VVLSTRFVKEHKRIRRHEATRDREVAATLSDIGPLLLGRDQRLF